MSSREQSMRAVAAIVFATAVWLIADVLPVSSAFAAPANVNLSARAGNQVEGAIAVDPQNPQRIYAVAMNAAPAGGLVAARSSDGGATWTRGTVGTGAEGLPVAAADPSVAYDAYGNLFLSYINKGTKNAQILGISTDGGASWKFLAALASQPDQPTVTTGPGTTPGTGSVWVSWSGNLGYMWAAGAQVTGLGAVGAFQSQAVPGSTGLNFGDIAVGPSGRVMVSMGPASGTTGGGIYVSTSAGAGSPFTEAQVATATGVGGFQAIPAQPNRGIDSESGLAYDRTGGAHSGRVYLMYTDATPAGSASTQIYVRHSDDNGISWSAPVKVNDDLGNASHFLPRIALDQSTGKIGVTWHDTRNDAMNLTTQFFGAFSSDGGETFTPNLQISAGISNQAGSNPPPNGYPALDYGDYTGSSFAGGVLFPIWADNSNSTADNPDGTLHQFDVYTAAVEAPATAVPPAISGVSPSEGPDAGGTSVTITGDNLSEASAVRFGGTTTGAFTVNSSSSITAISPAGTGTVDVTVTTPGGTSATSSADRFTYVQAPAVNRVEPAVGSKSGGTSVTITGTNLTGATEVNFGTSKASIYVVNSASSITAVAPAGAGSVHVTVTTAGGTSAIGPAGVFSYQEPPEFGLCGKVAKGSGVYGNPGCTVLGAGRSYEWYSAFGQATHLEKTGFTTSIKAPTTLLLQTKLGQRITCTGESGAGKFSGLKTVGSVSLTLTGCHPPSGPACTSAAAPPGTIVTVPLGGEVGILKAEVPATKDKLGLSLAPTGGQTVAEFVCGITAMTLRGAMIAQVEGNRMVMTTTLRFVQVKGIQKWTHFESGPEKVLELKREGAGFEQAGVTLTATQTAEEPIEINSTI